jgi:hypothetical protein
MIFVRKMLYSGHDKKPPHGRPTRLATRYDDPVAEEGCPRQGQTLQNKSPYFKCSKHTQALMLAFQNIRPTPWRISAWKCADLDFGVAWVGSPQGFRRLGS